MPERTVMVWIEDDTGTIVRGEADSVGADGVSVRLADMPELVEGDEVAVRICLEPGAPTVAMTARVDGVRADGDAVRCDLRWPAPAEPAVEAWPAHAA